MLDKSLFRGTTEEILDRFHSPRTGLNEEDVLKRRQEYGTNTIRHEESSWTDILIRQLKSSFVYLLIAALFISVFSGEYIDAALICLFLIINTVLGFYQEFRSQQTVRLLRNYLTKEVTVIREKLHKRVPFADLVPGDIVELRAGDLIPADIRFIDSSGLSVDESVLTGESAPLGKVHEGSHKLRDPINIGFSGTTVVSGTAVGVVVATGKNTGYAEIVRLAASTVKKSIFEREIDALSRFTIALVSGTLVFILLVHLGLDTETSFPALTLFAVALAVSVIPEGLPLVTTFSLSIGAMRLARSKVIVKRLSAIEDLGSIEVLCSDKTGTLTENRLTLDGYYGEGRDEVLFYNALAIPESGGRHRDPFDVAILSAVPQYQQFGEHVAVSSLPFDPDHKRTTVLVKVKDEFELVTRGAPESVITLCSGLTEKESQEVLSWVKSQGQDGKRVLAVARKRDVHHIKDLRAHENDMKFVGCLSFVDPIKFTTKPAVEEARKLGVALKILTGDSKEVSAAVAREIGLISDVKEVMTGAEFDALSLVEKKKAVMQYSVFARATPAQKHLIVSLLEDDYEVGFLGEGINDAPALKAGNVAIAVAGASDVAREASDIILLEKSLHVIINGIRQGRGVFVNTTKYIIATLSANFGNFFAIVLVSLMIPFLPLLPLQILLLNLLSDFPMIAIATDKVESRDIQKPQRYNIKNFSVYALLLGVVSTVFDFLFFAVFVRQGEAALHTSWFMGSVLTEILFLFSVRTRKFILFGGMPSRPILWLSAAAAVLAVAIPFVPFTRDLFMFRMPTASDMTVIGIILVLYVTATEGMKWLYYRFRLDMKFAQRSGVGSA